MRRGRVQEGKDRNLLFCEQKRSKKNFVNLVHIGVSGDASESESFLLLFYKKEVLAYPQPITDRAALARIGKLGHEIVLSKGSAWDFRRPGASP
jgi:hypothetical protein